MASDNWLRVSTRASYVMRSARSVKQPAKGSKVVEGQRPWPDPDVFRIDGPRVWQPGNEKVLPRGGEGELYPETLSVEPHTRFAARKRRSSSATW
jgi:hypothetical protein